jgi:hypothetical protein
MGRACSREGNQAYYKVLAGIPEGKRLFQKSRPKLKDDIKWRIGGCGLE